MNQEQQDLDQNQIDQGAPFGIEPQEAREEPKRKFTLKKILLYTIVIVILLIVFFFYDLISSGKNLSESLGQTGIFQQIKHLVTSEDKGIAGEADDRINGLILGVGGPNHDGPYLTDTMILASFKPSTNQAALISIPRDLVANLPGYGWYKINHANAYAEADNPGAGGTFTSEVVSKIFDIPVHYYVTIDFEGFVEIVDDLGGVEIDVERTFEDLRYPVFGKETATTTERYEHLFFEKGEQKMDGDEALKFARSRMAAGIEGSDYARARRQQKVIIAVKERILAWSTLVNPYKISRTLDNIGNHIRTNMEVWEIYRLYQLGDEVDEQNISHVILDDSPNGFLTAGVTELGAFILQPKTGDYIQLQQMAKNIFSSGQQDKIADKTKPAKYPTNNSNDDKDKIIEIGKKDFSIEIQNGTKVNGLAGRTSNLLQNKSFNINTVGNAREQDHQKTLIYDLSKNQEKSSHIKELEQIFLVKASVNLPGWINTSGAVNTGTDVLIILGQDYAND